MENQEHESHMIGRIIRFLELTEEKGIGPGGIAGAGNQTGQALPDEIREFQETYDMLQFIEGLPDGFLIYYADGDGQMIYANRELLRIFKCGTMEEFRELTGNSFRGAVYPEDWDLADTGISRQICGGRHEPEWAEYRIRCKDGSVCGVEDCSHLVRRKGARDILYTFIRELFGEGARLHMEQKQLLTEALEKANLAVKAKNTFLSNISHDMRTPLNAIFGFTSLAKDSLHDTEAAKGYLEQAEASGRKLLDMITKVLYVSSLAGAEGPAEVECDFCGTLREVYDFLLPQAEEKSISFKMDYGRVTHSGIYADQDKLRQLVMNLVNNAITYTKPGGTVSVTLKEKKKLPGNYATYCLKVKDTGVGIGESFLKSMFEPFSREKNSTLSGVHGIGLGLTIAKSIVDMMNGTIQAESSVDKGSTFTVTLTFRIQPVVDSAQDDRDRDGLNPCLRILLVEDNEINREIETELLERMGFTVDAVENGKAALERMEAALPGDYDLIITDLQMPVMDGWEAAAAVRRLPDPVLARIPIIALSANTLISGQRKALESGINAYLPKPMDFSALLETIEKITNWRNT